MEFGLMRVGIINVRSRSDRYVHLLAVRREGNVTCPVSVSVLCTRENFCDYSLSSAGRLEVAVAVGEFHYCIGVADVDPLGIVAGRIKRDSEWAMKSCGES